MKPKQMVGVRRVLRQVERAGQQTSRYIEGQLTRLDVTDLEAHVLWHLRKGARAVGELQRAFGVRPSTLTGVIDRLENRGYARRQPNSADRRSYVVELTPAGRRATAAVTAVIETFDTEIRSRVRDSDLEGFFAVTDAIDAIINAG